MKMNIWSFHWCGGLAWCLTLLTVSAAKEETQPIQFCKQDATSELDFCMAVTPYTNITSASTDLYVTITRNSLRAASIDRHDGWLGVGIGPTMKGALMFILYDDPLNPGRGMKTSIRTATGHQQPVELSDVDFLQGQEVPDIRVIRSGYDDDEDSPSSSSSSSSSASASNTARTGTAHILIYSAALWPKTTINPSSPAQPWIWAHNPTPLLLGTSDTLAMHPSIPDSSFFGFFWTDLASSVSSQANSPPTFPIPSPSHPAHLSTTTPPLIYRLGSPTLRSWMFHLHGFLTSTAFLVLYPVGVFLLRRRHHHHRFTASTRSSSLGSRPASASASASAATAFNFHWTIQSLASVLLALGAGLGWLLSRRLALVHQFLGLLVVALVAGQIGLGWWRRRGLGFLRGTTRTTWMAWKLLHVWVGRAVLVAGWANLWLGLRARGYGFLALVAVAVVVLVEGAVVAWVVTAGRWKGEEEEEEEEGKAGIATAADGLGEEYFELVGDDEEDEDEDEGGYDEDGRLKADVEWEERMRERGGGGGGGGDGGADDDKARRLKKLDVI